MGFSLPILVFAAPAIWFPRSRISTRRQLRVEPPHEVVALKLSPNRPVRVDADFDHVIPNRIGQLVERRLQVGWWPSSEDLQIAVHQ